MIFSAPLACFICFLLAESFVPVELVDGMLEFGW